MSGALVVLEGIDGCGKGTQIDLLRAAAPGAVFAKNPGQTALGEALRGVLFGSPGGTGAMDSAACSILYLAAHLQLLRDVVWPALEANKLVISDRWDAISGTVFGRCAIAPPVPKALEEVRMALQGPHPDAVLFYEGDPAVLLKRATGRTAESHQSGKSWSDVSRMTAIQDGYRALFRSRGMLGPTMGLVRIPADQGTPQEIFDKYTWPAVQRAAKSNGVKL